MVCIPCEKPSFSHLYLMNVLRLQGLPVSWPPFPARDSATGLLCLASSVLHSKIIVLFNLRISEPGKSDT